MMAEKKRKKQEQPKVKREELLRFLVTAPRYGEEAPKDYTFDELLQRCFTAEPAHAARKSLRDASRSQDTVKEHCRSKLVDIALLFLGVKDKLMRREAVVVFEEAKRLHRTRKINKEQSNMKAKRK